MASDFCILQPSGFFAWWDFVHTLPYQVYISIGLFFLSAVLAFPIARSVFFLVRTLTPRVWEWPDEARELMLWQTALLVRTGLLCAALSISKLALLLCQWPLWLFNAVFLVWLDSLCNLVRAVIVRRGVVGYNQEEKAGRVTLLREGSTVVKAILLMMAFYTLFIGPLVTNDENLQLVCFLGFFFALALALVPVANNIFGAHYVFLGNMVKGNMDMSVRQCLRGIVLDARMGFVVLSTRDKSHTFIPGGLVLSQPTFVHNNTLRPIRLAIRLSPQLPTATIRHVMQELDHRLLHQMAPLEDQQYQDLMALGQVTIAHAHSLSSSSTGGRKSGGTGGKTRQLGLGLREQHEEVERARGNQAYVALDASHKWVVLFQTFVQTESKQVFVELRAKYVEEITQILEREGVIYGTIEPR